MKLGAYLDLRGGGRPRLAHGVCAMHDVGSDVD